MTLTEFLLARIAEDEDPHEDHWQTPHGWRRLVAECEAKRRIVAAHPYDPAEGAHCCADPETAWGEEMFHGWDPCPTLAALASVYADHPDYRDEWKS